MVGGKGVLHHPWQGCVKEFGAKIRRNRKLLRVERKRNRV